jgi:hypothetical protein
MVCQHTVQFGRFGSPWGGIPALGEVLLAFIQVFSPHCKTTVNNALDRSFDGLAALNVP